MLENSIKVQGTRISIDNENFICLTDMAKAAADSRGLDIIKAWLQTSKTIDFLATWESLENKIFKVAHLNDFKDYTKKANKFSLSKWIELTDAIGIYVRRGVNSGIYAHIDIATEFGAYISPSFKLFLIKEFRRLKEQEIKAAGNLDWNVRRLFAKDQYHIQTYAVKEHKIPYLQIPIYKQSFAYAEEGDILNLALFGFTAKEWREANPELVAKGKNVRDFASINELQVLGILENKNAELLEEHVVYSTRLQILTALAEARLKILNRKLENSFRKTADGKLESFIRDAHNRLGMFPNQIKKIA